MSRVALIFGEVKLLKVFWKNLKALNKSGAVVTSLEDLRFLNKSGGILNVSKWTEKVKQEKFEGS